MRLSPRQRRSREIVAAIREAARQLLDRGDAEAITTQHIADRAGVSIGSLYRYFPNKDAVIAAIYDEEVASFAVENAEALERIRDPGEARTPSEAVRIFLESLVDSQLGRHRHLLEIHGRYYRDHHREFSLSPRIGIDQVEASIRALLEEHGAALGRVDLDHAAFLLSRGSSAIVRIAVEERPEKLGDPSFRDELVEMLTRYLIAGP
jgi:AcrR family transcriptional regulator